MKSGIRDQVEGTAKVVKGATKEKVGEITGDPQKKIEGAVDRAEGRLQQKTGQIKRDITRE
ncbi:MAG: CsbD family protein [Verrucomicrobiota bacterium]